MSKINGCQLDRVGDLPFEFYYGACTNFISQTEKVLMCFDVNQLKTCHIFNGTDFETGPMTKHRHEMTTGMALYHDQATGSTDPLDGSVRLILKYSGSFIPNKPFVTGSIFTNAHTEILDLETLNWIDAPDYPFAAQ